LERKHDGRSLSHAVPRPPATKCCHRLHAIQRQVAGSEFRLLNAAKWVLAVGRLYGSCCDYSCQFSAPQSIAAAISLVSVELQSFTSSGRLGYLLETGLVSRPMPSGQSGSCLHAAILQTLSFPQGAGPFKPSSAASRTIAPWRNRRRAVLRAFYSVGRRLGHRRCSTTRRLVVL
jgi:hypothetical protein